MATIEPSVTSITMPAALPVGSSPNSIEFSTAASSASLSARLTSRSVVNTTFQPGWAGTSSVNCHTDRSALTVNTSAPWVPRSTLSYWRSTPARPKTSSVWTRSP